MMGAASPPPPPPPKNFPLIPSALYCMDWRRVRVVEQFLCFYPLKGPNDMFFTPGANPRICETAIYEPAKGDESL